MAEDRSTSWRAMRLMRSARSAGGVSAHGRLKTQDGLADLNLVAGLQAARRERAGR